MKKKALFVLAIILVVVLCVSAWFYGYYNRKRNNNIPSKELMVSYCQNKSIDYATEQLQGYKNIYYNSNGVVEHISIMYED